jgi:hypothetical protein
MRGRAMVCGAGRTMICGAGVMPRTTADFASANKSAVADFAPRDFNLSYPEFDGTGPAALHLDQFEMGLVFTPRH